MTNRNVITDKKQSFLIHNPLFRDSVSLLVKWWYYISGKDLHIRLDTIVTTDVLKALERTKPSGKAMKDKYAAWQRDYESVWYLVQLETVTLYSLGPCFTHIAQHIVSSFNCCIKFVYSFSIYNIRPCLISVQIWYQPVFDISPCLISLQILYRYIFDIGPYIWYLCKYYINIYFDIGPYIWYLCKCYINIYFDICHQNVISVIKFWYLTKFDISLKN